MKKRIAILAFVSTALLLAACTPQQVDISGTVQVSIALTALAQTAAAPSSTPLPSEPTLAPTDTALAPSATPGPVVVYLDVFGDAQAQIQNRVVEPFILYYRDIPDYPHLVSITIQTVRDVPGYPYKAEAIFEGAITAGWLIGVQGGLVDWWLPECMMSCQFSDAFRAMYPEIVATMEP